MPQARCDVACTTLQALLLNAAHVTTLLLLQFQQQHLNHLNPPIPKSSAGPVILLHLLQSAARSNVLASASMDAIIHRRLLWDYGKV